MAEQKINSVIKRLVNYGIDSSPLCSYTIENIRKRSRVSRYLRMIKRSCKTVVKPISNFITKFSISVSPRKYEYSIPAISTETKDIIAMIISLISSRCR
jgi:hypothetical protein